MTQPRSPEDDALDAAFSDMMNATPDVPEALMARVMEDAVTHMPKRMRVSVWRQMITALGGWPAVGGLVATACVGVWAGGVLTEDLITAFGFTETATLDGGGSLGAFDLLLVDG